MSRSKKKISISTDSSNRKEGKRIASKRFRQRERMDIHHGRDPVMHSKYVTNPYNLCDWKSILDKDDPNYERYKRK